MTPWTHYKSAPVWHLYVEGCSIASFLSQEEAIVALWDVMQSGRNAVLVRAMEGVE